MPRLCGFLCLLCAIFAPVLTELQGAVTDEWLDLDIGEPAIKGAAVEENGVCTVTAGGRDMLASHAGDQFHFRYVKITGDFEIEARLTHSESSGTAKTRVGLMARDGADPMGAYHFLQLVRDELSGLRRDGMTQEVSHSFNGSKVPLPLWLRLARRRDRLRAAWGTDGIRWHTMLDNPASALPEDVLVGLAANAGSDHGKVIALFEHVYAGPPRDAKAAIGGETLCNGIRLPEEWPPSDGDAENGRPPAYLRSPPAIIPIDVGRQLFVDDFLITRTNLNRTFHNAQKYPDNPIVKPQTPAELEGGFINHELKLASAACPFDDGVFFDPADGMFKMWYSAGICHDTALAYSRDGIHWDRPSFDVVPGTNVVIPYDPDFARDGFSPWIDYSTGVRAERYKAFFYARSKSRGDGGYLYTSPDGIHWSQKSKIADGSIGDNTLLFYNPFRSKWCLSIRRGDRRGRIRHYIESNNFLSLANFVRGDTVFWAAADALDTPDPGWVVQDPAQLYTIAAAPYESLMLGVFTVHYGPSNDVCSKGRFPKLTQLKVAFSRDGFHWDRSNRNLFIPATKKDGDWDRGYLRGAGGCCLVVGDKLFFYYSAASGYNSDHAPHMYAGGSTQLAMLRRDGFASMDATDTAGELVTRSVRFGGKYLFVNLDAPQGHLTADVLDENEKIIEPFSAARCVPVSGDRTCMKVNWEGSSDLSALAGRCVKFRFHLSKGDLYSFWVSPTERGESNGFVAAGGPGFSGPMDVPRREH